MDQVHTQGESVSFNPASLEQLKIAVDTVDCTDTAWAILGQIETLILSLPSYQFNSEDQLNSINEQITEIRQSARYQVQYFARKDCENKLNELNSLKQDWDPQSQMQFNDGFKVVRRKQRSPRKISDETTNKKQKMVLMDTSNQFESLTIEEPPDFLVEPENTPVAAARASFRPNMAPINSNRQATRKERPVPPITIDNIPRKDLLIKQLRELTSGRITARVQGLGLKVFPQTAQAYQQVREFIDKFKLKSFTYQLPEHRELRVVIRGALSEVCPPKPTPESNPESATSFGTSLSALGAPPCRDLLALVNGFVKISHSNKSRLEKLNEIMALLGEVMSI
ncbi:hypothetical protein NPIL_129771 [Nephila pilipes]|uniref:Uncharacterized protein n=1 Tax=Nephila pilipes TaxID=299642 RepID=A0A8X6PEX2_NEPPI|nr:hypothetical protein NPIL_129771 [Nephila pilipes]